MTPDEKIKKFRENASGRIRIAQQKAAIELAVYIVDVLKLRTRIEGDGTNGKLKPLSDSYIQQRKGDLSFFTTKKNKKKVPYTPKKSPKLHPDTSPETSNITQTGQLLDALRGRAGGGKVTIDIKKTKRKPDMYGKKTNLTNEDVRKYVEEAGREFLKLSPDEKQEVIDLTTKIIMEQLKDLF